MSPAGLAAARCGTDFADEIVDPGEREAQAAAQSEQPDEFGIEGHRDATQSQRADKWGEKRCRKARPAQSVGCRRSSVLVFGGVAKLEAVSDKNPPRQFVPPLGQPVSRGEAGFGTSALASCPPGDKRSPGSGEFERPLKTVAQLIKIVQAVLTIGEARALSGRIECVLFLVIAGLDPAICQAPEIPWVKPGDDDGGGRSNLLGFSSKSPAPGIRRSRSTRSRRGWRGRGRWPRRRFQGKCASRPKRACSTSGHPGSIR